MRLVLFDIDGTLLDCGRQVRPILAGALEEVFGGSGDVDGYDFAGKTDGRIVLDLMGGAGFERQVILDRLDAVKDAYLRRLGGGLDVAGVKRLPGVADILERLSRRDDVAVGLLTGNWEAGARAKLRAGEIDRYFAFGAFADDAIDRDELPPIALERAAAHHGREFSTDRALIVGDSVLDVRCARAHDIDCLAVATSRTPAAALEAAGATWVVANLLEVPAALQEVLG